MQMKKEPLSVVKVIYKECYDDDETTTKKTHTQIKHMSRSRFLFEFFLISGKYNNNKKPAGKIVFWAHYIANWFSSFADARTHAHTYLRYFANIFLIHHPSLCLLPAHPHTLSY